ncbi:hypothetical protein SeMB42_g03121 [Synchytrium endobioticum]|uniref:3'-5' exonuclease domain-containing protein n=1 Tax=Synchytrium endobioticum TaxID=286115 RepID=A0A507CS54_9FUNG|nr:hypothetical protein SeLEV6574_g05831 [Synchytrium endobioticum]TPX48125.1 hypothetical protein SeMB42_g03121 [Synchytrium endobioticum]
MRTRGDRHDDDNDGRTTTTQEAVCKPPTLLQDWMLAGRNDDIPWLISQIVTPARAHDTGSLSDGIAAALKGSKDPYTLSLDILADAQIYKEGVPVQRRIFRLVSGCLRNLATPFWTSLPEADATGHVDGDAIRARVVSDNSDHVLAVDDRASAAPKPNDRNTSMHLVSSSNNVGSSSSPPRSAPKAPSCPSVLHLTARRSNRGLKPTTTHQERLLQLATAARNASMYIVLLKPFKVTPTSDQLVKMIEKATLSSANTELVTLVTKWGPVPSHINIVNLALDLIGQDDPGSARQIIGEEPLQQQLLVAQLEDLLQNEAARLQLSLESAQSQQRYRRISLFSKHAGRLLKSWKLDILDYPAIAFGNALRRAVWLSIETTEMQAKAGDFNPEGASAGPIELLEEIFTQCKDVYQSIILMMIIRGFASRQQTLPTAMYIAQKYRMLHHFDKASQMSPYSYGKRQLPPVEKPPNNLTVYEYQGSIEFIDSRRIDELMHLLFEKNVFVVGIDSEWKPDIDGGNCGPIFPSIFQVAFVKPVESSGWITDSGLDCNDRVSNGGEMVCYIIDCNELRRYPQLVEDFFNKFLETNRFVKLGFDLKSDLHILRSAFPSLSGKKCVNVLDLNSIPLQATDGSWHQSTSATKGSLADAARTYLGKYLNKSRRLCNWDRRPLSEASLRYAASDAMILLEIYQAYLARDGKGHELCTL